MKERKERGETKCEQVQRLLTLEYLEPEQQLIIQVHLMDDECPDCQQFADDQVSDLQKA